MSLLPSCFILFLIHDQNPTVEMGSYQLILPSLVGEVRPLFTLMSIGIAIIASENNKMYSKEKLNKTFL